MKPLNLPNLKIVFLQNLSIIWLAFPLAAVAEPESVGLGANKLREIVSAAQQRITEYPHEDQAHGPKLRIVYFTPADAQPQKDHRARLTRVMLHINAFLQAEMLRNGAAASALPLEMEGDLLKLHEVTGKLPAREYSYKSGGQTEQEMRTALAGKIDFDREFVLALYSHCTKNEDGSYFFYAPYYGKGGSNQRWGLCHAADCELLDPPLLTDTTHHIDYVEHYGKFHKTLADFNTAYLGGIAHELGHGLGLPHDCESPSEHNTLGTALMGGGNLTYGREKWMKGEAKGAFFTAASALRLASHPLLTGVAGNRMEAPVGAFQELSFAAKPHFLSVSGKLKSTVPCYAVIAYIDPGSRPADYDAVPYISLVQEDAFRIETDIPAPGPYALRLTMLHLNGAVTTQKFAFTAAFKDVLVDAEKLNHYSEAEAPQPELMLLDPADALQAGTALLASETRAAEKQTLEKLCAMLRSKTAPELDLTSVTEPSAWLSDAPWTEASVGWGNPARNRMGAPAMITGPFINLKNSYYLNGLYAHSPSRYVFTLGKKWTTFESTLGVNRGDAPERNTRFLVLGDGKEIFRSQLLNSALTQEVKLDVTGVQTLTLLSGQGSGPNGHSWAVWAAPKLTR